MMPHQGPVVNMYTIYTLCMELEIECEFFFSMLSLCLKLMLIDPPPGLAW